MVRCRLHIISDTVSFGLVNAEETCPFCELVAGRTPASIVFADEDALAVMDRQPLTPGHVLVLPTRHASGLSDLAEGAAAHMFTIALRTQRALRGSGLRCDGVNLFLADGEAAGQEVFHVHLHVLPRFEGDGFRVLYERSSRPRREDLDAAAARIRRAWR
jgi:histidine triad (HIT) family protein